MKIGYRLQQLDKMIIRQYDHIWDCCCDHGLLGMLLLKRNAATKVHFVDVVEPLMFELERKLERFFPHDPVNRRWQVHCKDIRQLDLSETAESSHNSPSHLVIIAGVGGDKVIEFVDAILSRHPNKNIEFLLCPVHHNYKVREALTLFDMKLNYEKLIRENNRFYELLHVSENGKYPISLVGSLMWDFSRSDDRDYLEKNIHHFAHKAKQGDVNYEKILLAYQQLSKEIS
ncbi:tRNA (adenine(22)-N(1))-methyltransferase TrmK [Aliikangiella coralliicola]|uniref:SAM-dependent methyltransferase n=1 Tax=Aliikangiella coralliicola TaxID=2592383 RepID=A0A545UG80_9GAMM|nr:tRNA (adenine(22)-N(1))-methyltransferase TrmK [Aliikangiella coralliicola]TQV88467.1 SAM-dependent methyltransferase [Aliikangiella coralliicola]